MMSAQKNKPVYVTQPLLLPLEDFLPIYPDLEMATVDAIIAMIAAPARQPELIHNIA